MKIEIKECELGDLIQFENDNIGLVLDPSATSSHSYVIAVKYPGLETRSKILICLSTDVSQIFYMTHGWQGSCQVKLVSKKHDC